MSWHRFMTGLGGTHMDMDMDMDMDMAGFVSLNQYGISLKRNISLKLIALRLPLTALVLRYRRDIARFTIRIHPSTV